VVRSLVANGIHIEKEEAVQQFEKLVKALERVGLATEVRMGDKHSLLVFVRVASQQHLFGEVYRSRYVDSLTYE
jgi:hypothetical protein